jgi:uncharacterized membrane protein
MDHFRSVFRQSWDDSFALFFAAPKWSVAVAAVVWIGGVGWNSVANWKGWPVMVASFTGWSCTILWPVAVFLAIFLFHVVYLTPKRMIATAEEKAVLEAERADTIEKELKSKIAKLEERLKSRITVRCGKDIEGCVVKDHRGIWYRARLDMTGANVSGVEATITGIWEDDVKVNLYGKNLDVSMCEKEEKGQTVTMREGRPEYINLLFAAYDADKPPVLSLKHYPAPLGERAYFKLNHEYQMSLVVTCDNTHPSLPFRVKMKLRSNDELEEFQQI